MKRTLWACDVDLFKRVMRRRGFTTITLAAAVETHSAAITDFGKGKLPTELMRGAIAGVLGVPVDRLWRPIEITDDGEVL